MAFHRGSLGRVTNVGPERAVLAAEWTPCMGAGGQPTRRADSGGRRRMSCMNSRDAIGLIIH